MPDLHLPFTTAEFRSFIDLWTPIHGLGVIAADKMEHELKVVVEAELQAAGRDVHIMFQKSLLVQEPKWRALDRLLRDLDDFCAAKAAAPDDEALYYRERIAKARHVLGLTDLVTT